MFKDNTTDIGRQAEKQAAKYLKSLGHKILTFNWRNRYCEIDIITQNKKIVNFVEVKYRKNNNFGDAIEAINQKKLKQMEFASKIWVSENNFKGDYRLMAISLEGIPPKIINLIEI